MSAAAAAAENPEVIPVPKSGKKKLILIVVVALLVLALAGGGVVWWLKKRAAHAAEMAAEEEGGTKVAEKKVDLAHPPTFLPLEPFVVNLADRDADRYAQIGVTLELESPAFAEQVKVFMPAVRNAILMVIAHKSAQDLLGRAGKEDLADEIMREALRPMGLDIQAPTRVREPASAIAKVEAAVPITVPASAPAATAAHEHGSASSPKRPWRRLPRRLRRRSPPRRPRPSPRHPCGSLPSPRRMAPRPGRTATVPGRSGTCTSRASSSSEPRAMTSQILSQDEVDALLQGISTDDAPASPEPDASGLKSYDLSGQERIVRGRMPNLEIVNERFARNLRNGLFQLLRKNAEFSAGAVKVHKYSVFLREITVPTSLNMVSVQPLRGNGLVICDPSLVFAAVDSLFGGNGKYYTRIEGREFSPTEQRVIRRLVDMVTSEYARAWAGTYPLELAYVRSEMLPQFATIATPSEVVVSTSFEMEIGDMSGSIHVCIPYATLEPIRDVLFSSVQARQRRRGRALGLAHEAADRRGRGRARRRARARARDGRAAAAPWRRATSSSSTSSAASRPRSPACRCSRATTASRTGNTP